MMKAEDFFLSLQMPEIPEEEYRKAEIVVSAIEAMSRTTYQSLYVIDYYKKNFLYVSENPLLLCGHTAQEVRELGYKFYLENVPGSEHAVLIEIYKAGFDFYEQLSADEKPEYTISYDFHILNGRNTTLVNHKLTPILLTDNGKIWLAVCVVNPSSRTGFKYVSMYRRGYPFYRKYSFDSHRWGKEEQRITLNEREREILLFTSQGYKMDEIAKKLYISPDTVGYHKKAILEKLQAGNMMEALLFAENYKLL